MGAHTWDNRLGRAFADKGCNYLWSNPRGFVSAAFLLVIPFQHEELSVNHAEMLSLHNFCKQRLNSLGKQVKFSTN